MVSTAQRFRPEAQGCRQATLGHVGELFPTATRLRWRCNPFRVGNNRVATQGWSNPGLCGI